MENGQIACYRSSIGWALCEQVVGSNLKGHNGTFITAILTELNNDVIFKTEVQTQPVCWVLLV